MPSRIVTGVVDKVIVKRVMVKKVMVKKVKKVMVIKVIVMLESLSESVSLSLESDRPSGSDGGQGSRGRGLERMRSPL